MMHRLVATLTLGVCLIPFNVHAERYSVEEDGIGGFTAKRVEESAVPQAAVLPQEDQSQQELPEQDLSRPELPEANSEEPAADNLASSAQTADSASNTDESASSNLTTESEEPAQTEETKARDKIIGDVGDSLSPFEKAFIESEKLEREKILKALKKAPRAEGYDATQVNEAEFVDGDQLLKGGRSASEKRSHYTVVDADGTVRNIDYDPEAVQAAIDEANKKSIEFTEANILHWSDSKVELPETADPFAAKLLKGDNTSSDYFKKFADSCCSRLPNIEQTEMELGKSYFFNLNEDILQYRFSGGDSRYILLTLPETKEAQALKLRSFIKRYKDFGVDSGVFFPQLITLDNDRKPLRIFSGPLLKYHPETWLAHGFLEGFFQIDSTEEGGERYLLVNTTRDILRQTSSIEDSKGLTTIEHMEMGTVELELVTDEK